VTVKAIDILHQADGIYFMNFNSQARLGLGGVMV
jgi:precorrin-2 methylase